MGIREKINQNPKLAGGVVVGLVLIAGVMIWLNRPREPVAESMSVFFSADDGTSFFVGPVTNHPPFDHQGREAVRAYVVACGPEEKGKVVYLMKYSPAGLQKLRDADAGENTDFTDALEKMPPTEILIKKPGDSQWVPSNHPTALQVRTPDCPPGSAIRVILPSDL